MKHTNSKLIVDAYYRYLKSNNNRLWDAYKKVSVAKVNAYEYCKNKKRELNGSYLKIISHNCQSFTVGFIGEIDNRNAFVYITKDNERFIYLDELGA